MWYTLSGSSQETGIAVELPYFWSLLDLREAEQAQTFEDLSIVALRVLETIQKRTGQRPVMVCGPITTGGVSCGDPQLRLRKNVERIRQAQRFLEDDFGFSVFNQLVFEGQLHAICRTGYYRGGEHLLTGFYLPLFASGKIEQLLFMPRWETSFGSRWEHQTAMKLKIRTGYLRYTPCGELEIENLPVQCPAKIRRV